MAKVASFSYKIWINGKLLDDNRMSHISQVVLEDSASGSDLLKIQISDPDLTFLGDDIILEKSKIKFAGTYEDTDGKTTKVEFTGYIAIIDVQFPDNNTPELVINCMDVTYLMDRKKKKRTWENKKASDVAQLIFKEYGLKTNIDATSKKLDTISQSDVTDIQFLVNLANDQSEEYLVYVSDNTGYFKKKKLPTSASVEFKYKQHPYDIRGFTPRIEKKKQASS